MDVFPDRGPGAWLWLLAWVVVFSIACLLAVFNPSIGWSLGGWTTQKASVFWVLILLLLFAWVMHRSDKKRHLYGFVDLHHTNGHTHLELAEGSLRGLLTVQSIRVALTLGVLGALLDRGGTILTLLTLESVVKDPTVTLFTAATAGLALSTLTTLAALQCYDYALRFVWGEPKANVKLKLVQKAHRLGKAGFYSLTWSLTAATALIRPGAGLIVTAVVFYVMWYVYFFPLKTRTRSFADQAAHEVKAKTAPGISLAPGEAKTYGKADGDPIGFTDVWPVTRVGVKALETVLPAWARSAATTVITIGDKISDPKSN